jgi:hypothetical protein
MELTMTGLVKIEKDLFSISQRLKEIDARYEVYRNTLASRFEIYIERALQFVVPFQKLDARTLEFARKTRIERRMQIMKEIDEHNERIERQKEKEILEKALCEAGL